MSLQAEPSSSRDPHRPARVKSKQCARVTYGLLLTTGNTSAWCTRVKDILAAYAVDYPDAATAEQSKIRRCAVLQHELELLEEKFNAAGQSGAKDLDLYQRTAGNLRRAQESLERGYHERRSRRDLNTGRTLSELIV